VKVVIAMSDPSRPKQAVVLIHGIGEQMPMITTRGFVKEIRPKGDWRVYSEADQADETFELHKYAAIPDKPKNQDAPRTDFYEGYWAQEARGTTLAHVWRWVRRVFFTTLFRAPPRLRWLYALAVSFAVLCVASVLVLLLTPAGTAISSSVPQNLVKVIVPVILGGLTGWMVKSLGDLARYTDDSPDNIDMRQNIRQRVVGLLEKLHDDEQYGRIIVVGHSLGGIVAYDALRLLWARRISGDNGKKLGRVDDGEVAREGRALTGTDGDLGAFCEQQHALYERLSERELYIPASNIVRGGQQQVRQPVWKVTDLITLGSPIAYPELLLADGKPDEFRTLKAERQLPTCPPQAIDGDDYRYEPTPGAGKLYHHGAMFAVTRWTNVYAHGDFAGAPIVDETLGAGVINKPLRGLPIISHSKYWKNPRGKEIIADVIDQPEKCHVSVIACQSDK
jgi:hypothetical protein